MSSGEGASNSRFVHLHVRSGYSYGQGVAHPDELVAAASGMGYERLALTDRDGVYGIPRFIAACSEHGIAPIVGAEVTVEAFGERGHIVLLCESAAGYATLTGLIAGYRLNPRSEGVEPTATERRMVACPLELLAEKVCAMGGLIYLSGALPYGLLARLAERGKWRAAKELLGSLSETFGAGNVFAELTDDRTRYSRRRLHQVYGLAAEAGVPVVATNEVSYVEPADHRLSEVMWAAYSGTSLPEPGHRPTDTLYLKSPEKMTRTFASLPEALQNTAHVAERCAGALGKTPDEFAAAISGAGKRQGAFAPAYRSGSNAHQGVSPGSGPEDRRRELLELVLAGARERYRGRTDVSYREVLARLRRELSCVGVLDYTSYFLLAAQAKQIAVSKGTPVTGRGSAANSLVCHVLGLTQPDPYERGNLLFERFMHEHRVDAPDIDIDLDSDLRDQALGELLARYADTGAAVASTAQEFSLKGAVRAASKALGYRPAEIDDLARGVPARIRDRDRVVNERVSSVWDHALAEPSMRNSVLQDRGTYPLLLDLSEKLAGRLHQAGTHLGGLVVGTDHRSLWQIVPMEASGKEGLPRIQWDKDDLDLLQIPKLDLLGLKLHTVLRKAGELVAKRVDEEVDPLSPPASDRATYRLIASGQTAGTFNLESPGQSELSRRLRPKRLEHIQAQISLFRPGPLRGSLVEPYVARKNGLEPYSVPLPELEEVLKETYGVLVYQESVLALSQRVAGYTLAEADQVRRAMTKDRGLDAMKEIREDFLQRTISRGTPADKAREVFELVANFAAYGFSAAHAASFAKIAYASAYMLAHYPAEFIGGGLLNSQPMGYYSPRVLVEEARRKGIAILPPDIHLSAEGFTVEDEGTAIRPGLSYCKGLSKRAIEEILAARDEEPFSSPADLYRKTSTSRDALTNLIEGGFLDGLARGSGCSAGVVRRELRDATVSLPVKEKALRSQPELPSPASPHPALPHPASFWESRRPEVRAIQSMPFPPSESLRRQRKVLGLDVEVHPLAPCRIVLRDLGVTPARDLRNLEGGTRARAAGIMESLQRPPASPATRRLAAALTVYTAAGLAALVAVPENSPLMVVLTATLYVVAAGFSLAAMGNAYLKSKGLERGLWGFLACGIGLRVLGDLGWVAFASLELPPPAAAAYQLAWAGSFVALFVGILLFIARVNRSTALLTALDTGAVMFSVALLSYYLLVSPVIGDGGGFDLWLREPSPDPQMPRRPAADAALLFLSLVVLSAQRKPPSAGFIAVAFGSFLVADGWLLRLYSTADAYDLSHPLGAFWVLGLILLGIAALSSEKSASGADSPSAGTPDIPSRSVASEASDETQPLWALAFWFGPLSPALLYSAALLWAVFDRSIPSYLLVGGVILMVYLAFRLSVLAYVNRTLTRERAEEARRLERARIAAELDEALERTVHAIPPMLDSYLEVRKTDPDAAEAALKQGITAAREASYRISYPVRELRAHSGDTTLGPDYLVDQLIGEVEANFEIKVHRYIAASPEVLTAAELAGAYRVVSEALWNAAKHSGARNIWVSTRWVGSVLLVKVRDDGRGFDTGRVSEGYGLALMRSRARDIGAALDIISGPTRGKVPRGSTVQLRFDLVGRLKLK